MRIFNLFLTHKDQLDIMSKVLRAVNILTDKAEGEEEIKSILESAIILTRGLDKLSKDQIKECGINQLLK